MWLESGAGTFENYARLKINGGRTLLPLHRDRVRSLFPPTSSSPSLQSLLASIISVLAMTYSDNGHRDTLHYRIVSKSRESPGSWGNEYVRHLAAELGEEYNLLIREQAGMTDAAETQGEAAINPEKPTAIPSIVESKETAVSGGAESVPAPTTGLQVSPANRPLKTRQQLLDLALELVPFFLAHNAEADAVDLLLEVESIESLVDEGFLEGKKGEDIYARVCQYMIRYVTLFSDRQRTADLSPPVAYLSSSPRMTRNSCALPLPSTPFTESSQKHSLLPYVYVIERWSANTLKDRKTRTFHQLASLLRY